MKKLPLLLLLLPGFAVMAASSGPITHTVFFKLQLEENSPEFQRFYQETMKLAEIPGVHKFQWLEETGKKNNFDYGLSMVFESKDAYDVYNRHPEHIRYVKDVWMPNVVDFQEIDYVQGSWQALLDPELSHWEVWTGVPHESVQDLPEGVSASRDGKNGIPVGLGDPFKLYQVYEGADGQLELLVTGEVFAGLTTRKDYENYHLTMEVKWGDKKWEPRLDRKRDSGLLYHCYGSHGAFWNVWMRCLEFQIQEGDFGDLHQLGGAALTRKNDEGTWDTDAALTNNKGRVRRSEDHEKPHGEWTRTDLYVLGDRAVHIVDGQVVLALQNAITHSGQPLKSGKIQLQSEAAECYYRDIRIRPINYFPTEIKEKANFL